MPTRNRTAPPLLEAPERQSRIRGLLGPATDGASLRDLVGRLGRETGELLRGEVALAKLELKETAAGMAKDSVMIVLALAIAAGGALALLAAAIIVLGDLLDAYWAGALIVGVALLAGAAITGWIALRRMRARDVAPKETIESIREDRAWAAGEAREFKREVIGGGTA